MRLLYFRARLGVCAALLASLANPALAAELHCFKQNAMQSARIHDLQVMLMVNALKCRERRPETLRRYGNLLEQRGAELGDHARKVEATLSEKFGSANGPVAFHRYETAIANYHSYPAPSQEQCEVIATYIDLATRADHAELETLSKLATSRSIDVCLTPVSGVGADETTQPAPLAQRAGLTRIAAADPVPQIIDGIPTYTVPGTGPNTAPEPLEKVAIAASGPAEAVVVPAPPSETSPAQDKLDQAILALSAAVTALSELRQQP